MKLVPRKILSNISGKIFMWFARNHLAWFCALFLRIHIKEIIRAYNDKNTINVLIVPKEGLNDDIRSSLARDGNLNVYLVHRNALKGISAGLLHPSLDDNNYVSRDPSVENSKEAYREFLIKVWKRLTRFIEFQAVLGGNFGYHAEHELGAALEERGIPFIALHKENLKSPGRVEFFSEIYQARRGKFAGRKIFVYNEIERQVQISSGVISPERVVVTGMPRLDRIHHWREKQEMDKDVIHQPRVLFFSFWVKTGLPLIARKARSGIPGGYEKLEDKLEKLNWDGLATGCHQAMLKLAKEYPEINVIIKSKGRLRETSAMYSLLGEQDVFPSNLNILVGGDPLELITKSDVVCGFNTTGLLEGIAANKPVIVPWFAEAFDKEMERYIVDLEEAVEYAYSPDELVDRLRSHALNPKPSNPELSNTRTRVLEKWVGNADGLAGKRVYEALMHEINS